MPVPDLVTLSVYLGIEVKVAETLQAAVILPVVYILPDNEPLQPLTELILKPVLGVTVKFVAEP